MLGRSVSEPAERLERAETLLAMRASEGLELVGADGSLRRLEGDTAALAEAVLVFCDVGRTRSEIRAHVEALTGGPLGDSPVVEQLVDLLRDAGALRRPRPAAPRPIGHARVVVGMGGAIAAAHAPLFVQALQALGHEVRVIASERALRFVAREALEALTHAPVLASMWGGEPPSEGAIAPHVALASWADLVVVWPASATMISRIATGDCSELVSAVAITTRAPVLVAPSMNEAMLDAASVARNLETLRRDGFHVAASTLAHEVADAPEARRAMPGGAAEPHALARMVDALLRAAQGAMPRDAASWEHFHRRVPEAQQPWVSSETDPTIMRLLAEHAPPPRTLWDVGTGHGAVAVAAARAGYQVVATDVSPTALERARSRAAGARIVWLRDDVTASALASEFDVVVDRGTLHTLPPASRAAYVETLAARSRPGTILLVTVHTPPADPRAPSHPLERAEVQDLFGASFEPLLAVEGTFAGALTPGPACVTCVLRRR